MSRHAEIGAAVAVWHLYIVRCGDWSLYTGIAGDVRRRLSEHREGGVRGARYLRGRGPLRLVLDRAIGSKSLALRVERRVKGLRRKAKEELIARRRLLDRLIDEAALPRARQVEDGVAAVDERAGRAADHEAVEGGSRLDG